MPKPRPTSPPKVSSNPRPNVGGISSKCITPFSSSRIETHSYEFAFGLCPDPIPSKPQITALGAYPYWTEASLLKHSHTTLYGSFAWGGYDGATA